MNCTASPWSHYAAKRLSVDPLRALLNVAPTSPVFNFHCNSSGASHPPEESDCYSSLLLLHWVFCFTARQQETLLRPIRVPYQTQKQAPPQNRKARLSSFAPNKNLIRCMRCLPALAKHLQSAIVAKGPQRADSL